MGFEIPVDVDYFDHPKTKHLRLILKRTEADIYPLRLWQWAAKYYRAGKIPDNVQFVESELGWNGGPGELHAALVEAKFIEKDGVRIHDWMEGIGRAIQMYEEKKKRQRDEYAARQQIPPEFFRKNGGSLPALFSYPNTLDTQDTKPRKKGGGAPAPQPPEDGTMPMAKRVALYWNAQQGVFKIGVAKAVHIVEAFVASGVTYAKIFDTIKNGKSAGKKLWDVLEPLAPKGPASETIEQKLERMKKVGG